MPQEEFEEGLIEEAASHVISSVSRREQDDH